MQLSAQQPSVLLLHLRPAFPPQTYWQEAEALPGPDRALNCQKKGIYITMGSVQATAEEARWNIICANWAGPRVLFPAQGQFQLSCGLPGLSYEAKAVVGKKMVRPVTVAGVWALKLSSHSGSISITGKRWGSTGSILSGTTWDL